MYRKKSTGGTCILSLKTKLVWVANFWNAVFADAIKNGDYFSIKKTRRVTILGLINSEKLSPCDPPANIEWSLTVRGLPGDPPKARWGQILEPLFSNWAWSVSPTLEMCSTDIIVQPETIPIIRSFISPRKSSCKYDKSCNSAGGGSNEQETSDSGGRARRSVSSRICSAFRA